MCGATLQSLYGVLKDALRAHEATETLVARSASASAAPPTAPLVLDGIGLVTRLLAGDLQCVEFTRAKGNPFRAPKPKAGAGSSGEPQAASAPGNLTAVKTPVVKWGGHRGSFSDHGSRPIQRQARYHYTRPRRVQVCCGECAD